MTDSNNPTPGIDKEDEDKILDDLDPDEAEAAGITGGGRTTNSSDDDYDPRVVN